MPETGRPGAPRAAPIWTRDFVLATLTNLMASCIFMGFVVTMAPYAVEHLGASEPQAGAAASIFVVGALLSRPFAGRYLEVIGRRRIVLVGTALQVVACGLYLVADSLVALMAVRLVHGVVFGSVNTALAASVISMLPARRRSEGTGYFGTSGVLAGAIAPLAAIPLLAVGPRALFTVALIVTVVALCLTLLLRLPGPQAPVERRGGGGIRSLLEPTVLPIACVMLFAGAGMASVMTYLSLYTPQVGLTELTGVFFLVYSASVLMTRPFVGRLHDRRGDNVIIYPAIASLAIALLLIGLAQNAVVLLAGAVFMATGFGTLMSSVQAIAVTLAPRERVGTAMATFFLLLDVGTGLGPIVLGFVAAWLGYSSMYLIMSVVVLTAIGVYHLAHGGTRHRRIGPAPDDLSAGGGR